MCLETEDLNTKDVLFPSTRVVPIALIIQRYFIGNAKLALRPGTSTTNVGISRNGQMHPLQDVWMSASTCILGMDVRF